MISAGVAETTNDFRPRIRIADGIQLREDAGMASDKPLGDLEDQTHPNDYDDYDPELEDVAERPVEVEPGALADADPADVADQQRVVPMVDDEPWL